MFGQWKLSFDEYENENINILTTKPLRLSPLVRRSIDPSTPDFFLFFFGLLTDLQNSCSRLVYHAYRTSRETSILVTRVGSWIYCLCTALSAQ